MRHRLPLLCVLAALVAPCGCNMCRDPFDYAGPVIGPNGPPCNFLARKGSLFVPIGETPPTVPPRPENTTPSRSVEPAPLAEGEAPLEPIAAEPITVGQNPAPEPARVEPLPSGIDHSDDNDQPPASQWRPRRL